MIYVKQLCYHNWNISSLINSLNILMTIDAEKCFHSSYNSTGKHFNFMIHSEEFLVRKILKTLWGLVCAKEVDYKKGKIHE